MDIEKIYFNNCEISRVKHTKYIGLEIDELLTWEYHINTEIISSLTKFFGIFYNIRHILNTKLKRTVYFSSIYSKIRYGLEIYGNCASKHFNKIQIIQNKLLRVLTNREPLYDNNQLPKVLSLIKLDESLSLQGNDNQSVVHGWGLVDGVISVISPLTMLVPVVVYP